MKGIHTEMAQAERPHQADLNPGINAVSLPDGTVGSAHHATDRSDQEVTAEGIWQSGPKVLFDERASLQPPLSAGQALRAIREQRGIDLSTVASELRLNEHYFMAIERMEVSGVPRGYLSKYVGSYAGYLGLSRDEVITAYTSECGAVETVEKPEKIVSADTKAAPAWRRPAVLVAAALPVCAMAGALYLAAEPAPADNSGAVITGQPLDGARESLFAGSPLPEGARSGTFPLTLTATRDAWLEVRGADGTVFRSRKMTAGETYHPRVGAGWTISARDGGAFEWRLGDAVIAPLGSDGAPVYSSRVDSAAALAAEKAAPSLASAGAGEPSR